MKYIAHNIEEQGMETDVSNNAYLSQKAAFATISYKVTKYYFCY